MVCVGVSELSRKERSEVQRERKKEVRKRENSGENKLRMSRS